MSPGTSCDVVRRALSPVNYAKLDQEKEKAEKEKADKLKASDESSDEAGDTP